MVVWWWWWWVPRQRSGIVGVVTLLLDDTDVGALLMLGWGAACLPVLLNYWVVFVLCVA
jgi:hypothetical protein